MGQPAPVTQPLDAGPAAAVVLALGGAQLGVLARAHRARQQMLALLTVRRLRALWRRLDPARPQESWATLNPRAVAVMTVAQTEAARGAAEYVAAALRMQGAEPDPAGTVPARAFAGVAADGRALDGLLGYPAFEAAALADRGMDHAQAAAISGRHLERIAATEIADAARVATGVATVNDRRARGYIRMLTPPSCSRCVILAGKWYATNDGFERHPQCDCVHIPAAEDVEGDLRTSARDYFDSMSEAEQDRVFTKAGARAVRDGADISQVVNARRGAAGLSFASGRLTEAEKQMLYGGRQRGRLQRTTVFGRDLYLTTEGVTTRGQAGRRMGARETGRKVGGSRYRVARGVRLMPESIYEIADGDRAEAIRLLKLYGYIL